MELYGNQFSLEGSVQYKVLEIKSDATSTVLASAQTVLPYGWLYYSECSAATALNVLVEN